jgi:hypothetical protein
VAESINVALATWRDDLLCEHGCVPTGLQLPVWQVPLIARNQPPEERLEA